jgi:hypothetical protein
MKTLLIVILALLLCGGAFLSRPNQQQFKAYLTSRYAKGSTNPVSHFLSGAYADQFIRESEFKDRLLWVDVQKDGKTVYTGAFSTWFEHSGTEKP